MFGVKHDRDNEQSRAELSESGPKHRKKSFDLRHRLKAVSDMMSTTELTSALDTGYTAAVMSHKTPRCHCNDKQLWFGSVFLF